MEKVCSTDDLNERIEALLSQLTLKEKIALTHGDFTSGGVPRLGISPLLAADGPVGIRLPGHKSKPATEADAEVLEMEPMEGQPIRSTALPATLLLASTWNRESTCLYADVIAAEMLAIDRHVIFAPGINLMRDPRCGRNFEYFGEDPYLTSEMAIAYTRALQVRGVAANLKHLVANECDKDRHFTSSNLAEDVLRELYAYPFERAIREADAWTVMTGNNLVNGDYVAESKPLLKELLRESIGYEGVVLTDWRAAYRAKPSMEATLDMTTGICQYVYGDGALETALAKGEVDQVLLDASVRRILTLYAKVGLLDEAPREAGRINVPEHRQRARLIAAEGMVLLKNEGLLPCVSAKRILLTGPGAAAAEIGTGSGLVNRGLGNVSPLEGLQELYGEAVVQHCPEFQEAELDGADLVIYCANAPRGGEGFDLESIQLDSDQIEAIRRIGAWTDKLLVVLQTGTATDTSDWDDAADALLVAWYGGEAAGHALADIVSGVVNPSGKLPCSFGNPIEDYPCAAMESWPSRLLLEAHPGDPGLTPETRRPLQAFSIDYIEGHLIGYRWFDRNQIVPRYPFGFGLSYTHFDLSEFALVVERDRWTFQCTVRNTGECDGAEVVQLYLGQPGSSDPRRPVRQLRGFQKVQVPAGESKEISISIQAKDLAVYDCDRGWICQAGQYQAWVATSSRELKWKADFELAGERLIGSALRESL